MATRYVSRKIAYLYTGTSGDSRQMVLIFGDELEADLSVPASNGRIPAAYRGRNGFVRTDALGTEAPLEAYFIDVGQGDSTFIVTPSRKKILIDGGVGLKALGFLIWKYRLDAGNSVNIDLMVLSHADADHLDGLVKVVQHQGVNVRDIIHSGIATHQQGSYDTALGDLDPSRAFLVTRHDDLASLGSNLSGAFSQWKSALEDEGVGYNAVHSGGSPPACLSGLFAEGTLEILGPRLGAGEPGFRWFGDAAQTINGHSVVLKLTYGQVQMLFPGDVNIPGSKYLLEDALLANRLSAHVLKAPHHGSHEFHPPFLASVRPQITVVSSGDDPDHGHPRAVFLGSVAAASRSEQPLIFCTQIAAAFIETGDALAPDDPQTLDEIDFSSSSANLTARKIFKQRLPGIVNVRTDGRNLFAARRVDAGYWWESYGPVVPQP